MVGASGKSDIVCDRNEDSGDVCVVLLFRRGNTAVGQLRMEGVV